MDSRTVLLSTAIFSAIGLVGCQTIKTDSMLSTSNNSHEVKDVTWGKTGELFHVPTDNNLAANESRVVFFRDSNDNEQLHNVKIGMGSDNTFHVSLQNGYYSDAVICSGDQIITIGKLNQESGQVISHSRNYQFIPQTTTYLQVFLSAAGSPVIQQIPADEALVLLNQTTRQTHQISRVLAGCNVSTSFPILASPQNPIVIPAVDKTEIKNPAQFNVLFDFNSTGVKSNHSAVLRSMANFIQAYPQMSVTLEGHTDNKGSESYNLKLSESRANMVKDILVDQYDVEAMRLSTVGYGETMPVDTNDTEKGRQNNRRVVAIVSQ